MSLFICFSICETYCTLSKGRVHLDEIYSQRMDKYYPGDFILHDNGERVIYWLDFGRRDG